MIPFSYVYMTQKGRLETEAMLLTATIRLSSDAPIVVGCGMPYQTFGGRVQDDTLAFLRKLKVRIVNCYHPMMSHHSEWGDHNKWCYCTNKLGILPHAIKAKRMAYLDSDIVVLDDFEKSPKLTGENIVICPMGFLDHIEKYEEFLGVECVTANGGTLVAPGHLWDNMVAMWVLNCQNGLANRWCEEYDIPNHQLDQLCLTRTVLQHQYACGVDKLNFSNQFFVHWFELKMLEQHAPGMARIRQAVERWPELLTIGPNTKFKRFLNQHFKGVSSNG